MCAPALDDDFTRLFARLEREWNASHLFAVDMFSGGLSGAAVFVVDIGLADHDGFAVLKCERPYDPTAFDVEERHARAQQDAPPDFRNHIPTVLASFRDANQSAILFTLAGDSYLDIVPLASIHNAAVRRRWIQRVCGGLLNEWNADYSRRPILTAPADLFREWLGEERLAPQGRIATRLNNLGIGKNNFVCCGELLPNPLAFAIDADRWSGLKLAAFYGHQHSDLNQNNILVQQHAGLNQRADFDNFYVIDCGSYCKAPFFSDVAYLEFCTLLHHRPTAKSEGWLRVLDAVSLASSRRGGHTDDVGLVELVQAIQREEDVWMAKEQPRRFDHVRGQRLLARVAAGLNFFGKMLAAPEVQRAAFLYAAHNLKSFLKLFGLRWLPDGVGNILMPA